MARNNELVRQWEILRAIDGARNGIAIAKLASERRVHPRTVRRDLDALGRAGFPLYDEKVNGTSMWKLRCRPFSRLEETGLGVMELCALYFSRTMMDRLAGAPLQDDAERAFAKLERALPLASRRFLDQLPRALQTKAGGHKKHDDRKLRDILARVLDATLLHRRATMRYASASSRRTKEYSIEPQRIAYADGGIYLLGWVPEYQQIRTFATERIETFGLTDEVFEPRPLPLEAFGDSLGVNTGKPEKIVIEFDARTAPFVREREWHKSQEITPLTDGRIRVELNVCNDYALRAWILGWGPGARVVSPRHLAEDVLEELNATRLQYAAPTRMVRASILKAG
ncbi:MAG: WYL domain-containing protein [Acidobacteria bacterium]|nr:WYL domain-containing protein [Acidobacteriota bacterium]